MITALPLSFLLRGPTFLSCGCLTTRIGSTTYWERHVQTWREGQARPPLERSHKGFRRYSLTFALGWPLTWCNDDNHSEKQSLLWKSYGDYVLRLSKSLLNRFRHDESDIRQTKPGFLSDLTSHALSGERSSLLTFKYSNHSWCGWTTNCCVHWFSLSSWQRILWRKKKQNKTKTAYVPMSWEPQYKKAVRFKNKTTRLREEDVINGAGCKRQCPLWRLSVSCGMNTKQPLWFDSLYMLMLWRPNSCCGSHEHPPLPTPPSHPPPFPQLPPSPFLHPASSPPSLNV